MRKLDAISELVTVLQSAQLVQLFREWYSLNFKPRKGYFAVLLRREALERATSPMRSLTLVAFLVSLIFAKAFQHNSLSLKKLSTARTRDLTKISRQAVTDEAACGPCPLAPKCKGEYSTKGECFHLILVCINVEEFQWNWLWWGPYQPVDGDVIRLIVLGDVIRLLMVTISDCGRWRQQTDCVWWRHQTVDGGVARLDGGVIRQTVDDEVIRLTLYGDVIRLTVNSDAIRLYKVTLSDWLRTVASSDWLEMVIASDWL